MIFYWRLQPNLLFWYASWRRLEWQKAEQLPVVDRKLAEALYQLELPRAKWLTTLTVAANHSKVVEMLLMLPGCAGVLPVAGLAALFPRLCYK